MYEQNDSRRSWRKQASETRCLHETQHPQKTLLTRTHIINIGNFDYTYCSMKAGALLQSEIKQQQNTKNKNMGREIKI